MFPALKSIKVLSHYISDGDLRVIARTGLSIEELSFGEKHDLDKDCRRYPYGRWVSDKVNFPSLHALSKLLPSRLPLPSLL